MASKTSSSITSKDDLPRLRLKVLRQKLGITQEKLAARCGKSYPYIIAVETGRLPVTSSLAEAISCATGVAPAWLLGKTGKISKPITPFREPLTREYFVANFEQRHGPLAEIDPDGDESSEIHSRCHELTQLMQAAYRKRRFPQALYFFRKMANDVTKRFGLARARTNDELEGLEKLLFGSVNRFREEFELNVLWTLMSPIGCEKWAKAFAGDGKIRAEFLRDLDDLRTLVEQSFEEKRRQKNSKTEC